MKTFLIRLVMIPTFLLLSLLSSPVLAADTTKAEIGKSAPAFELVSTSGEKVSLAKFKGQTVVLEWFNPDCPFVKLAHGKGPMKALAKEHRAAGGVWLAINSNASGMQGHGQARNKQAVTEYKLDYPLLLDESGTVGKAYGAKRTPQIFIIDSKGVLRYAGGLDSSRGGGYDEDYVNYTQDALKALGQGQAIGTSSTKAWGCSVKYGD